MCAGAYVWSETTSHPDKTPKQNSAKTGVLLFFSATKQASCFVSYFGVPPREVEQQNSKTANCFELFSPSVKLPIATNSPELGSDLLSPDLCLTMKGASNPLQLLEQLKNAQISSQRLLELCLDPAKSTNTHTTKTTARNWSDFWVFDNSLYKHWIKEPYSSPTTLYVSHRDPKAIKNTTDLIVQDLIERDGASVFTFMFESGAVGKNSSAFSRALLYKLATMQSADQHRDALLRRYSEALTDTVKAEWKKKTPGFKKLADKACEDLFKSKDPYLMEALQLTLEECVLEWRVPFAVLICGLDSVASDDQRESEPAQFRARLVRIINILRNRVCCKVFFTGRSSTLLGDSKEFKLLDYSAILSG